MYDIETKGEKRERKNHSLVRVMNLETGMVFKVIRILDRRISEKPQLLIGRIS